MRRFSPMLNKLTKAFFAQSKVLVGKSNSKVMPNGKVAVQFSYYVPFTEPALTEAKINALGVAITQLYKTAPMVELRLVRLRYPYLDSSILAQYVAVNAGKYNFLRMQKMMFSKLPMGNTMSGVKLELAGRLTTQRSIPRKTVENGHKGSFSQLNTSLDFSQYASKNKLGAFTIKVWLSS